MSDVYRSVSNRSFGDNLLESIKSFLVGLALFVVAFPILWMNEGCTDMSTVAKTAIVVPADGSGSLGEGALVAVTSDLRAVEQVGDPEYLAPGPYVSLHRKVETWAWVEKKETTREKKLGGGSRDTTTYTYKKDWTDHVQDSDEFGQTEGHLNPESTIRGSSFRAKRASVGAFGFDAGDIKLPPEEPVAITAAMVVVKEPPPPVEPTATAKAKTPPGKQPVKPAVVKPAASAKPGASAKPAASAKPGASAKPAGSAAVGDDDDGDDDEKPKASPLPPAKLAGNYLFRGNGSLEEPAVGDVRISFEAVLPGKQVTLYGTRHGTEVAPYLYEGKDELFRVVPGTHEQAIAALHSEHVKLTWALRLIGFLAMWIGLSLTISPIAAVLDVLPIAGSAARFLTGLIMLPVAAILAGTTIVVSILAHNPILLAVVVGGILALLVGAIVLARKRKQRAAPA